MTTVTANSAPAGSDSASQSLTLDDAAALDFRDPDEKDNNDVWRPSVEEDKEKSVSLEQGADSLETDDEGDEPAAEEAGANEADKADADKADETPDPDAVPILLKGGEQVTLGELKNGYMRDKDYRHKTTAVATARKSLESTAARVIKSVDAVAGFLAQQLPEEPPRHLAMTDPGEYTRRKAMFDAGMEQIQSILSLANDTKAASSEMTQEKTDEEMAHENAMLVDSFPELQKPDVRDKFFADVFDAGTEIGLKPEEMAAFTDHRYFKALHWVKKGLEAEKAKQQAEIAKKTALQKVANAPPIVAKTKQSTGKTAGNRDAMRKLTQTGRLKDVLNVDF